MFSVLQLNRRHRVALFATLIAAAAFLLFGEPVKSALGVVLLGIAFAWAFGSDDRFVHLLFLACGVLIIVVTPTRDWNSHRDRARRYQEEVAGFERRIPELANNYPLLPSPLPAVSSDGAPGTITVPLSELHEATGISSQGFIPDPTQNYSPPAELQLTRSQLLHAIRTKEPAHSSANDNVLIDDFLNMYPDWRKVLVGGEFLADSQPKWYADAVEAGVSVTEVPDDEKPGSPPEPFGFSQSMSKNLLLIVLGLFFFFTGVGLLLGVRFARPGS